MCWLRADPLIEYINIIGAYQLFKAEIDRSSRFYPCLSYLISLWKICLYTFQTLMQTHYDCKICFTNLQEPVVTYCGHLYCWKCLYNWALERDNSIIPCPCCNTEIDISLVTPIYTEVKDDETGCADVPRRPKPDVYVFNNSRCSNASIRNRLLNPHLGKRRVNIVPGMALRMMLQTTLHLIVLIIIPSSMEVVSIYGKKWVKWLSLDIRTKAYLFGLLEFESNFHMTFDILAALLVFITVGLLITMVILNRRADKTP